MDGRTDNFGSHPIKWLPTTLKVLAVASVAALVLLAPKAAVAVIALLLIIVLPASAFLSAWDAPTDAWRTSGRSRTAWMIAFFIIPFGVSFVASVAYFVRVRRQLPRTRLASGEEVRVSLPGQPSETGVIVRRDLYSLGLLRVVKLEGERGESTVRRVAPMHLRPIGDAGEASMRPNGSIVRRLSFLGLAMSLGGVVIVATGVRAGGGLGVITTILGGVACGLGGFLAITTGFNVGPARRLTRTS